MKALIVGGGRSCTNWVFSIVRHSELYDGVINRKEERNLHVYGVHDGYCGKACIEVSGMSEELLDGLMSEHSDLKLVWCAKHPLAHAMAKIHRGLDKTTGEFNGLDGTPETAAEWVRTSFRWWLSLSRKHKGRVCLVRLEALVLDGVNTVKSLIEFLGAKISDRQARWLLDSYLFARNSAHIKRYKKIDESQARIADNVDTAYDGFFSDKGDWIEYLKGNLAPLIEAYDD